MHPPELWGRVNLVYRDSVVSCAKCPVYKHTLITDLRRDHRCPLHETYRERQIQDVFKEGVVEGASL